MIIVDGKKIAKKILANVKKEVAKLKPLTLAVVLVGKDEASLLFIKKKQEVAKELGIGFKLFEFEEKITNRKLRQALARIVKQRRNNGVLVQLPLPAHLNCQYLLDAIPLKKDVDVLSSYALGKFYTGKSKILPAVVAAVLKVLEQYDIKVESRSVVIVGAGRLVGKPLMVEFLRRQATTAVLNSRTPSLADYTLKADILISGVGKAGILNATMIKKGAVVIDAGLKSEVSPSGKVVFKGDILPQALKKRASLVVPSLGGLGPITVAVVMENLVKLAENC